MQTEGVTKWRKTVTLSWYVKVIKSFKIQFEKKIKEVYFEYGEV